MQLVALLAASCTGDATTTDSDEAEATSAAAPEQPYAGWQARPISALDPELVDDLIAGRGAGYALSAELNSYPGPTQVLMMATELSLTVEQEASVQDIFDAMQPEAQTLGRDLLDLEANLDEQFRNSSITYAMLEQLTSEISVVDGQLRAAHLAAHLDVTALLFKEQVDKYDELRGYSGESGAMDNSPHNME